MYLHAHAQWKWSFKIYVVPDRGGFDTCCNCKPLQQLYIICWTMALQFLLCLALVPSVAHFAFLAPLSRNINCRWVFTKWTINGSCFWRKDFLSTTAAHIKRIASFWFSWVLWVLASTSPTLWLLDMYTLWPLPLQNSAQSGSRLKMYSLNCLECGAWGSVHGVICSSTSFLCKCHNVDRMKTDLESSTRATVLAMAIGLKQWVERPADVLHSSTWAEHLKLV